VSFQNNAGLVVFAPRTGDVWSMPSAGPEGPLNYWNPQPGDAKLPPIRPEDEIEQVAWFLLLPIGALAGIASSCPSFVLFDVAAGAIPGPVEVQVTIAGVILVGVAALLGYWIFRTFAFQRSRPLRLGWAIGIFLILFLCIVAGGYGLITGK
jgi:hypothetical protein